MHDTYSYPLVWFLLLILVEKWFSNIIAHYDVLVAVILKAEKKIRCTKFSIKVSIAVLNHPIRPQNMKGSAKGKVTYSWQIKNNNCISRLTEIIRKPWLIKNLFFIARKNFFLKRHLFVFFQSTAWVITR